MVGAQTIVGDVVSPRERGRYLGIFMAMFGVTTVIGPLVGGAFVDYHRLAVDLLHQHPDRRRRPGGHGRGPARGVEPGPPGHRLPGDRPCWPCRPPPWCCSPAWGARPTRGPRPSSSAWAWPGWSWAWPSCSPSDGRWTRSSPWPLFRNKVFNAVSAIGFVDRLRHVRSHDLPAPVPPGGEGGQRHPVRGAAVPHDGRPVRGLGGLGHPGQPVGPVQGLPGGGHRPDHRRPVPDVPHRGHHRGVDHGRLHGHLRPGAGPGHVGAAGGGAERRPLRGVGHGHLGVLLLPDDRGLVRHGRLRHHLRQPHPQQHPPRRCTWPRRRPASTSTPRTPPPSTSSRPPSRPGSSPASPTPCRPCSSSGCPSPSWPSS